MAQHATARPRATAVGRRCVTAALAIALVLAATACSQRENTRFAAPHGKGAPRPPAAAKPANCDKDAAGQLVRFPAIVDVTRCAWRATATSMVQVGGTLVLWTPSGSGNPGGVTPGKAPAVTLRAVDIDNGGELWNSPPVELGDPAAGGHETVAPGSDHPVVLRSGDTVYIALVTVRHNPTSALASASVNTTVRFYPLSGRGTVQPKVYTAPPGDFMPSPTKPGAAGDGGQLLLRKAGVSDQPDEYLVVDPASATGKTFPRGGQFAPNRPETPAAVTRSGDVVVRFSEQRQAVATDRFGLRRADGSPVWDGKDHAPPGADPQAGTVVGVRGKYLIVEWRPQGTAETAGIGNVRPAIVALHDAKTGQAIVASSRLDVLDRGDSDPDTRTLLSANERYLVVGRVVFDLRENRALEPLPTALSVNAVGPTGVVYGTGNDFRPVAYDATQRTIAWEGTERVALPNALSHNTAVFQLGGADSAVVAFTVTR